MSTATAAVLSPFRALGLAQSGFCLLPEPIPILTCSQTPQEPGEPQKPTAASVPTSSVMTSRAQLSQASALGSHKNAPTKFRIIILNKWLSPSSALQPA